MPAVHGLTHSENGTLSSPAFFYSDYNDRRSNSYAFMRIADKGAKNIFTPDYSTSHQSKTMVGYCEPISAGTIEIQIWIGSSPGYAGCDCHTGWNNSTCLLEVEEVY